MDVRIRVLAVIALVLALQSAGCGRKEKPDDMLMAISRDDANALKELLAKGEDPNAVRAGRDTPLSVAIASGRVAVARVLLEAGADPNVDAGGQPAIHAAVLRGNTELVRLLAEHGADVNVPDRGGLSPLASAIMRQRLEEAEVLISYGAKEVWGGRSGAALALAVRKGDVSRIESLLASGADPNEPMAGGNLPLHAAIGGRHPEVVKALLEGGADPNAPMGGLTPLFTVVRANKLGFAKLLLDHGADVNAMPPGRGTPLMLARARGQMEMAAMLQAHGARCPWGEFRGGALFDAIERADDDALARLLEEGTDPDLRGPERMNAIHLAVLAGKPSAARLLLEHGADAEVPSRSGMKPLHVAAIQGHLEVAEVLLAHGANASADDGAGRTPLVYAMAVENEEMARLLEEHGGRDYVPLDHMSDWSLPEMHIGKGVATDTQVDPFGPS